MKTRRTMPPTGRTILVVDDQQNMRGAVRTLLECEGHRVLSAEGSQAVLAELARETVQVMVVACGPTSNAEDLIQRVRQRDPLVQIVLQADGPAERTPREMLTQLAIQGYHMTSDGPERLLLWVECCLKAYDHLAQLHDSERLKTELLASVSHEFRTPLNVILGYIDLVRDGTFGACAAETTPVFDKVIHNANHLLELVEDFLDLSKLEAGGMVIRSEPVALTPFLRDLADSFALLVRDKPVEFVTFIPDPLPTVSAEAGKLRIVIQNLLANAAKFTSRGKIGLGAQVLPDGLVSILVTDTGPGIAPEHQEAVFDVFKQLGPHEGAKKGVGLGLALARRFARMMQGDVTLESRVGVGTTFRVVLPAAASTPALAIAKSAREAAA
jgi:signal transduction histidine kinase